MGLPFGVSNNRLLPSANRISNQPGDVLQLPSELNKVPLPTYVVEVGDTIFVETTQFDATIRLPGDQVVQPDGMVSLGEFGQAFVLGKTVEQIESEVQSLIQSSVRASLTAEFEQEEQRYEDLTDDEVSQPDFEDSISSPLRPQTSEDEQIREQRLIALERRIEESLKKNRVSVRLVNWDSKKIYVLGEVNSPGSFAFTGNQTVLDA
ncbi:MAG: polysaccharide biosynthesis/export family protein, partial [Planctomycetota bacterium]